MVNLPNKNHLVNGDTTEAEFQEAMGGLYDFVAQLSASGGPESLEINSGGQVTPTHTNIRVETENESASDNLDFIVNTNLGNKTIIVRNTSSARPVTIRHNQSGSGKFWLLGATNFVLRDPTYSIMFTWDTDNSRWTELYRSVPTAIPSADSAAIVASLNLGTAAARDVGTSTGQIPLRENFGTAAFVNTGTGNGQVPLSNQLGSLAWLSQISDAQLSGSGVSPGTYDSVTVNAQGRVTGGTAVTSAFSQKIIRIFTTSGTYTPTAGMKTCEVEVQGGGGGAGSGGGLPGTGIGGTSSFGSFMTATGGGFGVGNGAGTPGTATGGTINRPGGWGASGVSSGIATGGLSFLGFAGMCHTNPNYVQPPTGWGAGGAVVNIGGISGGGGVGGGGGYCKRIFTAAQIGSSQTFVVGLGGGNAGGTTTGYVYAVGGAGVVIVTEYL